MQTAFVDVHTKPKRPNRLATPEVTVAIVSYNGMKVLPSCIQSVFAQTYQNFRVLLVNNASTDGTPEWVAEHYPQVEIIHNSENKGPNPARNLGILKSENDLVLLMDDDAVLSESCLEELVNASRMYPEAAIWDPRIVYHDKRDTIQLDGTYIHYISEAILLDAEKPLSEGVKDITPIQAAAGICLLINKAAAESIGLFDEDYFFGRTDGEFTFRLTLSGYKLYAVPQAICYHRVKKRGLSKVFYQVRNRWYFTLTLYSYRTLILSAPALFVYEICLVFFMLLKGRIKEYLTAVFEVIVQLPALLQKRRSIQSLRKVPDREILHSGLINIRGDLVENPVIASLKSLLNRFLNSYWKLIYPMV
ncbi:MAG: glycosyltransferase family 2 protein [Leptolyngbyaceae cyanobacterium]